MPETDETFQPEMSPLKSEAPANMPFMWVTDETFQSEMSPLKSEAPMNMPYM